MGPVRFVFAAVASEDYSLLGVHHHCSEFTGANAPRASVAGLFVDYYCPVFFLVEGVSRAGGNACWVFAMSACDG